MEEEGAMGSGRLSSFIITLVVGATVLVALVLAQGDALWQPSRPSFVPPIIADGIIISPKETPIEAIPFSTATLTATLDYSQVTAAAQLPEQCGEVPAGWKVTEVQLGDTIFSLAARHGVPIQQIKEVNCLLPDSLSPGMILNLPLLPPQVVCAPQPGWVSTTIPAGATLTSLAAVYHTDPIIIMEANCLTSENIYAGQSLLLPPLAPTTFPTITSTLLPSPTAMPPTSPPRPTNTAAAPPTSRPTSAPPPVRNTSTPTLTAAPIDTAVPPTSTPTATPPETATSSPVPKPTDAPPLPTDTPLPAPTDTAVPSPTDPTKIPLP
ncbi:MAG: LysM peptidoglycan-binding domain-containing protein [Chloroflexi bacterium]|nr:LysM peptidoglycan-binding domain-containing protein [Chloroflexota bacterium]